MRNRKNTFYMNRKIVKYLTIYKNHAIIEKKRGSENVGINSHRFTESK